MWENYLTFNLISHYHCHAFATLKRYHKEYRVSHVQRRYSGEVAGAVWESYLTFNLISHYYCHAIATLKRYRKEYLMFNDDIQVTVWENYLTFNLISHYHCHAIATLKRYRKEYRCLMFNDDIQVTVKLRKFLIWLSSKHLTLRTFRGKITFFSQIYSR